MKVYVHDNSPMKHRVLVVDDGGNAAPWPVEQKMSYAVSMALISQENKELVPEMLPIALFGHDVHLLGDIVDNDVELACALLLVGYEGEQYYVICGPTMRKLSAVERYLENTIGTTDVEMWPVAHGNVTQVLQSHNDLSHVASRVTVVLDDGAVMYVEAKGVPKHVGVKIYNVVHPDDLAFKDQNELGRLKLHDGQVFESAEEILVDVVHVDCRLAGTVFTRT